MGPRQAFWRIVDSCLMGRFYRSLGRSYNPHEPACQPGALILRLPEEMRDALRKLKPEHTQDRQS